MKDEDAPNPSNSLLQLPKTRITIEDGEFVRRSDAGGITMRIPLDDIQAVRFRRPFNPVSLLPLFLGAGLAALGYFVSEYNVMTVLLYVAAMCLVVFGCFGLRDDVLVLTVREQNVSISCPDATDEVSGFNASLQSMIGTR